IPPSGSPPNEATLSNCWKSLKPLVPRKPNNLNGSPSNRCYVRPLGCSLVNDCSEHLNGLSKGGLASKGIVAIFDIILWQSDPQ
ncbi:14892_t:CDS:2, partial [Racocetra persica]